MVGRAALRGALNIPKRVAAAFKVCVPQQIHPRLGVGPNDQADIIEVEVAAHANGIETKNLVG
jgi:hypothetical protein